MVPRTSARTTRHRTVIANGAGCAAGHLFTEHPGLGLIDVYAAVVDDFPYAAGVHVHYPESVLPMNDGLPKLKDLPSEMGGSGISAVE